MHFESLIYCIYTCHLSDGNSCTPKRHYPIEQKLPLPDVGMPREESASFNNGRQAFKPQRPVSKTTKSTTSKTTTKTVSRRKSAPPQRAPSHSSNGDDSFDEVPQANKENEDDGLRPDDPAQSIPHDLLKTLLKLSFKDQEVGIGREASLLIGKYMDTFVREAIARAAFERAESSEHSNGGDFLEVGNSAPGDSSYAQTGLRKCTDRTANCSLTGRGS